MAKSGRTKQKEADLEYNVAKQVERMLTYVLHSLFIYTFSYAKTACNMKGSVVAQVWAIYLVF